MDWLIADVDAIGPAETAEEAAGRPIPDFGGAANRSCDAGR